jgi:dGTPase
VRHPLTYVMEACDDIAYSVVDAEDTIKKGYASFDDLVSYLESKSKNDKDDESKKILSGVLKKAKCKNSEFRVQS